MAASTSSSLGSWVSRSFFNGSETELSLRNCVPVQSMPGTATTVFEEGLAIPPIKLYSAGVRNEAVLTVIRRNTRGDVPAAATAAA